MNRHGCGALSSVFTLFALALLPLKAVADPVTVGVSGFVSVVLPGAGDPAPLLADAFTVGERVVVSYTFETSTPEVDVSVADPNVASYDGGLISLTVAFPESGLSFVIGGEPSNVAVINDMSLGGVLRLDSLRFVAPVTAASEVAGLPARIVQVGFTSRRPFAGDPPPLVTSLEVPTRPFPFGEGAFTLIVTDVPGELVSPSVTVLFVPGGAEPPVFPVDLDFDGVVDSEDNCPATSNPDQRDRGGIGTTEPDGVGDACQNGDVNGDGIVDIEDVVVLRRGIVGAAPGFDPSFPVQPAP